VSFFLNLSSEKGLVIINAFREFLKTHLLIVTYRNSSFFFFHPILQQFEVRCGPKVRAIKNRLTRLVAPAIIFYEWPRSYADFRE